MSNNNYFPTNAYQNNNLHYPYPSNNNYSFQPNYNTNLNYFNSPSKPIPYSNPYINYQNNRNPPYINNYNNFNNAFPSFPQQNQQQQQAQVFDYKKQQQMEYRDYLNKQIQQKQQHQQQQQLNIITNQSRRSYESDNYSNQLLNQNQDVMQQKLRERKMKEDYGMDLKKQIEEKNKRKELERQKEREYDLLLEKKIQQELLKEKEEKEKMELIKKEEKKKLNEIYQQQQQQQVAKPEIKKERIASPIKQVNNNNNKPPPNNINNNNNNQGNLFRQRPNSSSRLDSFIKGNPPVMTNNPYLQKQDKPFKPVIPTTTKPLNQTNKQNDNLDNQYKNTSDPDQILNFITKDIMNNTSSEFRKSNCFKETTSTNNQNDNNNPLRNSRLSFGNKYGNMIMQASSDSFKQRPISIRQSLTQNNFFNSRELNLDELTPPPSLKSNREKFKDTNGFVNHCIEKNFNQDQFNNNDNNIKNSIELKLSTSSLKKLTFGDNLYKETTQTQKTNTSNLNQGNIDLSSLNYHSKYENDSTLKSKYGESFKESMFMQSLGGESKLIKANLPNDSNLFQTWKREEEQTQQQQPTEIKGKLKISTKDYNKLFKNKSNKNEIQPINLNDKKYDEIKEMVELQSSFVNNIENDTFKGSCLFDENNEEDKLLFTKGKNKQNNQDTYSKLQKILKRNNNTSTNDNYNQLDIYNYSETSMNQSEHEHNESENVQSEHSKKDPQQPGLLDSFSDIIVDEDNNKDNNDVCQDRYEENEQERNNTDNDNGNCNKTKDDVVENSFSSSIHSNEHNANETLQKQMNFFDEDVNFENVKISKSKNDIVLPTNNEVNFSKDNKNRHMNLFEETSQFKESMIQPQDNNNDIVDDSYCNQIIENLDKYKKMALTNSFKDD